MDAAQSKRCMTQVTDQPPIEGAANRQATDGSTWYGAASSSSSASAVTMSINELHATLSAFAANCSFCGAGILGMPFDPRQLMQLHMQNERVARGELPPLDDDDEDLYAAMDEHTSTVVSPMTSALPSAAQLSITQRMLTMRLVCCSGRCWMAESLARQGENSVFGKALAREFPSLTPDKAGEPLYSIYQQKAHAFQQQMLQRAMARAQVFQQQQQAPSNVVVDTGVPDHYHSSASSSSFASAPMFAMDDVGDLMDD